MNQTVVDRVAPQLGSLVHPGDGKAVKPFPIPLPMFRTAALSPQMMEQFAAEANLPTPDIARLVTEAIVALIEQDHTIIPNTDVAAMQAAAKASEPLRNQRIELKCRCGTPLFTAEVQGFDTTNPTIYAPPVIKHMQQIHPECALGHKAVN